MPLRLGQFAQSIINRRTRHTHEIDKAPATEQPSSSAAPLIFESLEPRLLLAADPLGISAGYAFNEVSGTTTADASGHGLTGTLTNGPVFAAGKNGNAITLDGTNDFVDLGNPTALQLTGSMTISAWINSSAFPFDDAAIVSKRGGGPLTGFQLDTSVDTGARTIGFKLTNSSGGQMIRYGATTLQANTWYYVTGVYDAAAQTMHVYLNGQLDDGVSQGTVTSTQRNSTFNVDIGQRPGNPGTFNFNGLIDDVRIANHALTQDQIQTDMVTPLAGAAPGPDTVAPSVPTGLVATPVSTTQINLSWNASTDNVGVTGYQVFRDGQQIATTTTTSFSNTGLTPETTYQYAVSASDAAGNTSALTTAVSATTPAPDTIAPTIALTAPNAATPLAGTVAVSANASDNVGVVGVQFLLDNNALGAEDTTSPYSISWDTTTTANGTHTLTARARDVSGNTALSAPVTVNVTNAIPATPAFVQVNAATPRTNQSAVTVTYTSAQVVGDTNILAIGWNNATSNITSVIDSAGNTYQLAVPTARGSGISQAIYYAKNIKAAAAGTNTVTVTFSASTPFIDIRALEYRGLDPVNPFDIGTSASGSGTSANSGTVTTTSAGALIFGAGTTAGGFTAAGANFVNRIITAFQDIAEDRFVTTTGSYSATASLGGSVAWVMQVATFRAASPTGGDTIAPTAAITAPAGGAAVSGAVTVAATASDNVGVAGVQFLLDNNALGAEDTTSPYSISWDTTTTANGTHTLTARARDVSGNTALSAPVTVNVTNTGIFQSEILATNFNLPTTMAFLPDGKMLVGELGGAIRLVLPPYTQIQQTPFFQISNIGRNSVEQGLYDIAVDPNFANNHYLYVTYTANSPNHDRLSRFTVNASLTGIVPGSELVLYEDSQNSGVDHHGGAIMFGNDGKIYFTTGDDEVPSDSQSLTSPHGKVLRINPDGTVPTDNPFYDGAGPNYDAIWALGLRNPYRAFYDAQTGQMFIGDVGGNVWSTAIEELNLGVRGANYGWPNVEAPNGNPAYTAPIYYYTHIVNGTPRDAAITAGFVYRGTQFPTAYQGNFFFADYVQNWIKRATLDANGNVTGVFNFQPLDGSLDGPYGDIVKLVQGPDGALYYVDIGFDDVAGTSGVSKIRRISFVNSDLPPVVSASANPTQGPTPLTVNFSSAGSSDPEGKPLTYSWNFGDNTTSTTANPTHTYNVAGTYQARLTVSDGVNSTLSAPLSISAGNQPVVTLATTPADGGLFRAGDVISFSAQATDIEDGQLPASAYTWNIDFLHEGHVHPGTPISGVTSGTFTIPTSGHDFSGFTRYRITVTVTDSSGLQSTQSAIIYPDKVNLTFDTVPAGLTFYLDGIAHTGPLVLDDLIGFNHTIEAPNQTIGTNTYNFASWSDGGTQQHTIVVASAAQTYTANYTTTVAGPAAAYAFDETAGTTASDASGNGLTGTLTNGPVFAAGKNDNAIRLDGTNDFVNLGNPTALQLTGSMTISAWINSSAFPFDDAAIVSKRGGGPLTGFQLDTSVDTGARTIGFKLTNSSGGQMIRYGATTLQANTWYYVTGVYDAAAQTMHVYLNGQLDDGVLQGTVTSTQLNSTFNVNIGQRPGNPGTFNFNGLIDDVRIYNLPLTVAEIQTDMITRVTSGSTA